jgi:hypothetical protein
MADLGPLAQSQTSLGYRSGEQAFLVNSVWAERGHNCNLMAHCRSEEHKLGAESDVGETAILQISYSNALDSRRCGGGYVE